MDGLGGGDPASGAGSDSVDLWATEGKSKRQTFLSLSYSISSGRCRWISALKARPSFQLGMERRR